MDRNTFLYQEEKGYILVGIMVFATLALLLVSASLEISSSTASIRGAVNTNTSNFYDVERSINSVTAWLQNNSKNIVTAFNSDNFSKNFELGAPVVGDNQGDGPLLPTMIKMAGTNDSVQLSNSEYFGSSAFPSTTNIESGEDFDAVTEFQGADFGEGVNIRLLVVWALETDGHYEPIFRVDAATGGDIPERGIHGLNFIKSALVVTDGGSNGPGYYADNGDFQTSTPNNQCWSYQYTWNGTAWSRGAARSNCLITGRDDIAIKSAIHGDVRTNKRNGINLDGGSISGVQCANAGCVDYSLPNNPSWATVCGGVPIRDVTVTTTPYSLTSGAAVSAQCYRNVTVNSNKTLVFATADFPYYIQKLTLQNNSNSRMNFTTVGPGHKYTIYTENFNNGSINGNQLVSTNLAPHQLEVYINSAGTLTLNGTASMNGIITGRSDHTIKHSGNFTFYGAYRSNAVQLIGNATIGYDEAITTGSALTLSDMNFTLYKASQRYR